MTKHANFNNNDSKCNNSMEIQINTQYSKKNVKSMGKKVKNIVNIFIFSYFFSLI
jgi:hypothetical protein